MMFPGISEDAPPPKAKRGSVCCGALPTAKRSSLAFGGGAGASGDGAGSASGGGPSSSGDTFGDALASQNISSMQKRVSQLAPNPRRSSAAVQMHTSDMFVGGVVQERL